MHSKTHPMAAAAAALVALAILSTTPASAGFVTGHDLLDSCRPLAADPVYRLKLAECRGYVLAIADASECSRKNIEFRWDSATGTAQHGIVKTVVDWLRAHPAALDYKADGLVAAALSDAFPCDDITADRRP